jgi:aspartyl protease family protein
VRRYLLMLLIGLGLVLFVLAMRHDDGGTIAGLSTDDIGSLVYKTILVLFVGAGLVTMFRDRFSQAIETALFWIVVALVLVVGYTYRFDLRDIGDRVMAEVVPGRAASRGRSVEIARGNTGDFQIGAQVNGARIPMVLDTGASSVVLTNDAARAAGLPIEMIKYTVTVETANGRTQAAPVTLDRLAIGNVVERSVPALIAQPGQLKRSLLGMSFLNRLQSWEVRGDKLVMRGYP